jgi:hypothetical protein
MRTMLDHHTFIIVVGALLFVAVGMFLRWTPLGRRLMDWLTRRDLSTSTTSGQVTAAIDFEYTGCFQETDVCFAAGVAVGRRVPRPWYRGGGYEEVEVLEKHFMAVKLPRRSARESWSTVWKREGYQVSCFEEFWDRVDSKTGNKENLQVLERIQARAALDSQDQLASEMEQLLFCIESRYGTVQYVFDTLHSDTVWLNLMLSGMGKLPLMYKRTGKYGVDSYEIDSLVAGIVMERTGLLPIHQDYKRDIAPFKARLRARIPAEAVHDHSPENDATNMLYMALLMADN